MIMKNGSWCLDFESVCTAGKSMRKGEAHGTAMRKGDAHEKAKGKFKGKGYKGVIGKDGEIDESFVVAETQDQMMVFNGRYPANAVKPNTPLP